MDSHSLLGMEEKILIICDTHSEMDAMWDELRTRLKVLQEALNTFIKRKSNSPYKHQFSIAIFDLKGSVKVTCPFTSSYDLLEDAINSIAPSLRESAVSQAAQSSSSSTFDVFLEDEEEEDDGDHSPHLDLSHVIESALLQSESVNIDLEASYSISCPAAITRVILIYGRSFEIPICDLNSNIRKALRQPTMYLDILYLHLKTSLEGVLCQDIFDSLTALQDLDFVEGEEEVDISSRSSRSTREGGGSGSGSGSGGGGVDFHKNNFIFESHNSTIKFQTIVALLLGHAVQRLTQEDMMKAIDITV